MKSVANCYWQNFSTHTHTLIVDRLPAADGFTKPWLIFLVGLGLLIYAAGSIWLVKKQVKGNQGASTVFPWQNKTAAGKNSGFFLPSSTSHPTTFSSYLLLPTSTPLQGPGKYACAPTGDCTDYSDEARQSCPRTFADRSCLNQCGNPGVRCTH